MKLDQSFEVSAPLERVWAALIDVERVAPCLPGAAVLGRNEDGSYNGEFKVKIGPTSAAYSGKLSVEEVDEQAHRAVMQAAGTDKRGQGGAKATIVSSVAEASPGKTTVEVATEYHIIGRLARFGRAGVIEEISDRLLNEFAARLQGMLAGEDGGAAAVEVPVEDPIEAAQAEAADTATGPPPARDQPPPPASAAPADDESIQGLSLVGSALWGNAKRRPVPAAAILVTLLALLGLARRRG